MSRFAAKNLVAPFILVTCLLICSAVLACQSHAQAAATSLPDALHRLMNLHLSRIDGTVPVYYSEGLKEVALRDQAEIADCAGWYSQQLGITIPVTLGVLNEADWDRVGNLLGYPMAQAPPADGNVIFMPDSFAKFPGQATHVDLDKKLDFISFHETGHLFQGALHLDGPDMFMQEFSATMLATAYALAKRPELIDATLESRTSAKQRYTSFEDIDLIYTGVGFDNYDWLQVETVRLAVYFVKGQDLRTLVKKLQKAFPAGGTFSNRQVFSALDTIRPGMLAQAGSLAGPTTLTKISPGPCRSSPHKQDAMGYFGLRNETGHPISAVDDGTATVLDPGYNAQRGRIGSQLKLHTGKCITYTDTPGYVLLR
jgi:hypothetical protein